MATSAMLETPSRIWRRIEAIEDRDMPSLPSLPPFEDSEVMQHDYDDQFQEDLEIDNISSRIHSTPPSAHHTIASTARPPDLSMMDALESVSRASSPPFSPEAMDRRETPKKNYNYSISLKSEPKASPFEKYRNVSLRRTNSRARTPSLSHSSSQPSSPPHSTPQSNKSIALPPSNPASPISAIAIPLPRSTTASPAIIIHRPEEDDTPSGDDDAYGETEDQQDSQNDEEVQDASHDEREPTFSSEGDATPYPSANRPTGQNTSAFSSPAQSVTFTPTPAFSRPRARFDLPLPPSDLLTTPAPKFQEEHVDPNDEEDENPLTPHTRRRSFLLDVINSTARPRMKFPTPHPRKFGTPSITESTPGPGVNSGGSFSPGPSLQAAFMGVTQRPRMAPSRRMSHPLSQTISASSHGTSESEASPVSGGNPAPWVAQSPYDGTADRASFISTASSHDLTTHHRVNTSFDPAMGFGAGAPGHGVGRFNAAKLNNYLHGLNRRLQEENENLMERLKAFEAKKEDAASDAVEPNRRLSGASRRASSVGTSLGNVQEDVAEGWLEEKAELEDMVEEFKNELTTCMAEKEEVERALEQEKEGRERDKERWKERMAEVEQGVSAIIADLEQKLQAAERQTKKAEEEASRRVKEMAKELEEIRGDRDVAMERASKAERVLESEKDLGGALKEANERVAQVMSDLRNANTQIKELEEEVMRSDGRIDNLEKDQKEDKDIIADLEQELNSRSDALAADRAKMQQLEDTIRKLDAELTSTRVYIDEMEDYAVAKSDRVQKVEGELASAQSTIKSMSAAEQQASIASKALEEELNNARELARQMEQALEEAKEKILHNEELVTDLQSRLTTLERERQREAEVSRAPVEAGPTEAELQAMENELDNAHREIARLTTMLSQSPARKAMEKARDTKIEMLEREKEELLERNKALRMTFNDMNTPNKLVNASGISPIHRQVLSMSIRVPKTPGGPLRDISWLNNSPADPSVSPLVAEIQRLQGELDRANESIDDKLDKLENAVSETVNHLRNEYVAHPESHDSCRHELDLRQLEIDQLRRNLEDRANDLQRVKKEKAKIASEKSDVARTVAILEADLKCVRRDAEAFGRDLKLLRMEKDKLETKHAEEVSKTERSKKQTQVQIRSLNEQLETQKEKTLKTREEIKNHICAADEHQLSKMKLQHNKECKGLIVQIRYLKAKFTRESVFRNDLTYQKQYLLVLLTQFEKSERTIFASIARIGFPVALPLPPHRKVRKLKSVALMVIFLSRVERSSMAWKEHSSSKQAVAAALEDVRRKRALPT